MIRGVNHCPDMGKKHKVLIHIIIKKAMKINNILKFCLCFMLFLTSCSQPPQTINYTYVATNQVPAETDRGDAQTQIAEASSSVGSSLAELSAIQIATNPGADLPPINAYALGMTERVTVNWNGPVEPLMKKIAKISNYYYRSVGEEPAIPLLVSIDAKNQMLGDILQNLIYQVHTKADVLVDGRRRIIELRYHES